jgi:hypothetical protein
VVVIRRSPGPHLLITTGGYGFFEDVTKKAESAPKKAKPKGVLEQLGGADVPE